MSRRKATNSRPKGKVRRGLLRASTVVGCLAMVIVALIAGLVFGQTEMEEEVKRREVLMNEASLLIHEGDILKNGGSVGEAMVAYQAAYDKLPDAPRFLILRSTAREKYAEVANEWARILAAEGRYDEAKKVVTTVQERKYDPGNEGAEALLNDLEDPDKYNPALSPEHMLDVEEVKEFLSLGSHYIDLGDFERAQEMYEKALVLDPTNSAARKGMSTIEEYRYRYHDGAARMHTRKKMLREVVQEWETPVVQSTEELDLLKQKSSLGTTEEEITFGESKLKRKLESITVPNVDFNGAQVGGVIEFLRIRVKELDPENIGFNIVLDSEIDQTALVSIKVNNVPLGTLLGYICDQIDARYVVEEFAINIVPLNHQSQTLIDRRYVVPPGFIETVPVDPGAGGGGPVDPFAPQGGNQGLNVRPLTAKEMFESRGVTFPPGSMASLNPAAGILVVRNTQQNINIIEMFVENARAAQPKMVKISVTVMRVSGSTLKELGFDWLVGPSNIGSTERAFWSGGVAGNSPAEIDGTTFPFLSPLGTPIGTNPLTAGLRSSGDLESGGISIDSLISGGIGDSLSRSAGQFAFSGVFTDPQVQTVVRALDQQKGVDFLSMPSVVTKGGNRATIHLVREFPFPLEFEAPAIPNAVGNNGGGLIPITPATPQEFVVRDIGTLLEVEPVVGDDNYRVDLNLVPEISSFEGFIDYGNPITFVNSFVPGGAANSNVLPSTPNRYLQPIFRSNRISTNVSVYDGQTVVLGGLLTNRLISINDKVPGLGDLPILGRLFRAEVQKEERINIVFFVRVDVLDPSGKPFHSRTEYSASNP